MQQSMDERDRTVAEVIRRAQPDLADRNVSIASSIDTVTESAIADLVAARVSIDEDLDKIWHLIGLGEASVHAFEALRSSLAVEVETVFATSVRHMEPSEQRRVVDSIDVSISLAAVRSLRHERFESVEETTRILREQIRRIIATARPSAQGSDTTCASAHA